MDLDYGVAPRIPVTDMGHLVPVVVEFTHGRVPWVAHLYDRHQRAVHRFDLDYCRRDDRLMHTFRDSGPGLKLAGIVTQPAWAHPSVDVHVPRPLLYSADFSSVEVAGICYCRVCDDHFDVRDHCAHLFEDPNLGILGPGSPAAEADQLARVRALAARFPPLGGRFADALEVGRVRWVVAVSMAGGPSTVLEVAGESWDDFVARDLVPAMQEDADAWRAVWWLVSLDGVPDETMRATVDALRLGAG